MIQDIRMVVIGVGVGLMVGVGVGIVWCKSKWGGKVMNGEDMVKEYGGERVGV